MDNGRNCSFMQAHTAMSECLTYINYGYDIEELPFTERKAGAELFKSMLQISKQLAFIDEYDIGEIDEAFGIGSGNADT